MPIVLRWRCFVSCLASNPSIFPPPCCSRNPRLSTAACAQHQDVHDRTVASSPRLAAVVRLVTQRCRKRRHACFRSSRGAADVTNRKRVAFENCGSKFVWWSSWEVCAFLRGKVAGGGVWRAQNVRHLRHVGSPTGARVWTACAPICAVVPRSAPRPALHALSGSRLVGLKSYVVALIVLHLSAAIFHELRHLRLLPRLAVDPCWSTQLPIHHVSFV